MPVTTLEQDIVRLYQPQVKAQFSINQIATKLAKTYPYIHHTVKSLLERSVMVATPIGRSHLCTLNLQSDECLNILAMNAIDSRDRAVSRNKFLGAIVDALKKLNKHVPIWTAMMVNDEAYIVVEHIDEKRLDLCGQNIPYSKQTIITIDDLRERIAEPEGGDLREHRTLLYGFENYFSTLADVEWALQTMYSPLAPEQMLKSR